MIDTAINRYALDKWWTVCLIITVDYKPDSFNHSIHLLEVSQWHSV